MSRRGGRRGHRERGRPGPGGPGGTGWFDGPGGGGPGGPAGPGAPGGYGRPGGPGEAGEAGEAGGFGGYGGPGGYGGAGEGGGSGDGDGQGSDLHTLTGAYALHALPEDERARFERHLAVCAACEQEVLELSATAGRLGSAVSVEPPPELRDRVLTRITSVRQDPPGVPRPARPEGSRPHGPRTHGAGTHGAGTHGARPDAGGGEDGGGRTRAAGGGRRGSRGISYFVLAACLAVLSGGLGGVAVWQRQEARDARAEAQAAERRSEQLARVLTAPDARTGSAPLGDGANGTVVVSRSEDRAAFLASGLPELPGGKVYQLWFDDGGTMRSAGLLTLAAGKDTGSAAGAVLMEGRVGEAGGVGITVEPAGGSPQPTTEPLALLELPAV